MPQACTATRTSPGPGSGRTRSTTVSGPRAERTWAERIVVTMCLPGRLENRVHDVECVAAARSGCWPVITADSGCCASSAPRRRRPAPADGALTQMPGVRALRGPRVRRCSHELPRRGADFTRTAHLHEIGGGGADFGQIHPILRRSVSPARCHQNGCEHPVHLGAVRDATGRCAASWCRSHGHPSSAQRYRLYRLVRIVSAQGASGSRKRLLARGWTQTTPRHSLGGGIQPEQFRQVCLVRCGGDEGGEAAVGAGALARCL